VGTLLRSCEEVLEPMEPSFGVGSGIHVLDGGSHVLKGRDGFWGCVPPLIGLLVSMAYLLREMCSTRV